jgi:hypothetical protein
MRGYKALSTDGGTEGEMKIYGNAYHGNSKSSIRGNVGEW